MNLHVFKLGAFAVALVASANPALAGSSSGSLSVLATVIDNCTVVASPMNFGAGLTNVGSANVDTTATLTLACTPNASFNVAMDSGSHALSGARRMRGTVRGEFLPYEIYTTSGRSQRWGQTQGTDTVAGSAPTGAASLTAYGRIPQGVTTVSADAYSDTVTVTVNF